MPIEVFKGENGRFLHMLHGRLDPFPLKTRAKNVVVVDTLLPRLPHKVWLDVFGKVVGDVGQIDAVIRLVKTVEQHAMLHGDKGVAFYHFDNFLNLLSIFYGDSVGYYDDVIIACRWGERVPKNGRFVPFCNEVGAGRRGKQLVRTIPVCTTSSVSPLNGPSFREGDRYCEARASAKGGEP